MKESERQEVLKFIKNRIPMYLDLDTFDLKYDTTNIYYKIYKYIKELQEDLKDLKIGRKGGE